MGDVFSTTKRSEVMARIRGKGNRSTELKLIDLLKELKISGWRRGIKIDGNPDIVFPKPRITVFVDGCFWHGCPKHATWPKNNAEFWRNKIERNMQRDREVNRELKKRGWRVFRVWEHELKLKNRKRLLYRFRRIGLLPSSSD